METTQTQPTVVLVPCLSGAPWDPAQTAMLAHRPLRFLRLPEGLDDIERYADVLAAEVADLEDYVLAGDSFGANIALALAVRQPAGLRALVMSGGFAANPIGSSVLKTAMRTMSKLRGAAYRQMVLRTHAHLLASPFDAEGEIPWSEAESRRLFLENTPARSYGARVSAVVKADYTDALHRVQVPTLIITPAHDQLVGAEAAKTMLDGITDAREIVLERTGHMFRFSHPGRYSRTIDAFLADTIEREHIDAQI
jgi:pimeloyl-ACP methyl ester carboxylesterase